ncbi:hypothetical protein GAR05_06137 [Micromonospora saelicesensis]|uniref:Uncharacterized protein n=1 Tax=Micromonospora saelicesensis TaxID=285676 RepID=A0ABX9CAD0_9ACTN|nr:hypothetical protein [Micromonospora saelicesensis]RAN92645.1 hypothetical protein GAR05_06137 [Micromonospora saelicesensis]
MIVTVTPTIGDGTVVRWYYTESDAEQPGIEPVISASRNGVRIGVFFHQLPDGLFATAQETYEQLRRDSNADVKHLATHRRRNLFGPLEPVPPTP